MKNLEDLGNRLDKLNEVELNEFSALVDILEEKWNVKAPSNEVFVMPEETVAPSAQTEYDVELVSFGPKKIQVIKVVRTMTGLSLKEAKELVEKAPAVVMSGLSEMDAEEARRVIEDVGGVVAVK